MALEQTVKDLQAQNAQFQEMMLSLSKGQEELKALLLEKKKAFLSFFFSSKRAFSSSCPLDKLKIISWN